MPNKIKLNLENLSVKSFETTQSIKGGDLVTSLCSDVDAGCSKYCTKYGANCTWGHNCSDYKTDVC